MFQHIQEDLPTSRRHFWYWNVVLFFSIHRWPFWMIPLSLSIFHLLSSFFYACMYRRTALTHVQKLPSVDENMKVVFAFTFFFLWIYFFCILVISAYIFVDLLGLYRGYVSATFCFLQRSPINNTRQWQKIIVKIINREIETGKEKLQIFPFCSDYQRRQ